MMKDAKPASVPHSGPALGGPLTSGRDELAAPGPRAPVPSVLRADGSIGARAEPTPVGPRVESPLLARRRRGWELGLPSYIDVSAGRVGGIAQPPAIIAVGGGKGGVGKSLVAANLAARLAGGGLKVLAIDLDVGGANLHTYFGVTAPAWNLADAIVFRTKSLREVMTRTSVDGVRLVAGGREEAWGGAGVLSNAVLATLFQAILGLKEDGDADVVILDLGAGTHRHTIDFFLAANLGLMTVLPEPTSIENAYLFLKLALFRLIETVGERTGAQATASEVKNILIMGESAGRAGGSTEARKSAGASGGATAGAARAQGYVDRLRQISTIYPVFVSQLGQALMGRTLGIAVNQVRSQKDIDVGRSMEMIGERYFGFQSRFCGYLNYDDAAWKSLRNRRLLVVDFPHSALSRRFVDVAKTVLNNIGL